MLDHFGREEGVLVHRDEVQLVAHPGAGQHLVAHVQRDGHQQVVLDLALVVVHELPGVRIDVLDHEVGDDLDVLLLQDVAQVLGRDGLGEGARKRRGVDQLDPVAHALLVEEPVGQHQELQRRDRALDRVLDDVDDQPAALPGAQMLGQRHGAFDGVEVEDRLVPLVLLQAGRLFGLRLRAGGDHQEVVVEDPAIGELHAVVVGLDDLDRRHDHLDARRDEVALGLHHIVLAVHPERDEQETGLIVVRLVLIDDGHLPFVAVQQPAQPVGHHGAGRAGAENQTASS